MYVHAYIYTCIHTCLRLCMYAYIYIHIHQRQKKQKSKRTLSIVARTGPLLGDVTSTPAHSAPISGSSAHPLPSPNTYADVSRVLTPVGPPLRVPPVEYSEGTLLLLPPRSRYARNGDGDVASPVDGTPYGDGDVACLEGNGGTLQRSR